MIITKTIDNFTAKYGEKIALCAIAVIVIYLVITQ